MIHESKIIIEMEYERILPGWKPRRYGNCICKTVLFCFKEVVLVERKSLDNFVLVVLLDHLRNQFN